MPLGATSFYKNMPIKDTQLKGNWANSLSLLFFHLKVVWFVTFRKVKILESIYIARKLKTKSHIYIFGVR